MSEFSFSQIFNVEGIGTVGVFSEEMRKSVHLSLSYHKDRSFPVIIEGETGTGKEVIARLVHYGKDNDDSELPFISVNCSVIVSSLFESELFGYEKGAFTGANIKGAKGKFELAHGGTLFLDEIGDLPLDLQPKLLRVLQEKCLYRVGGNKLIPVDVRVIAATNQDLRELISKGLFREDLYYRLNMGEIKLLPLREQRNSIPHLSDMFLKKFSNDRKKRFICIHRETYENLKNKPWYGNVRELKNVIQRAVLLNNERELLPVHLANNPFNSFSPFNETGTESSLMKIILPTNGKFEKMCLPDDHIDLKALELELVKEALDLNNNNKTKTAEYLGISRNALLRKLKKCY